MSNEAVTVLQNTSPPGTGGHVGLLLEPVWRLVRSTHVGLGKKHFTHWPSTQPPASPTGQIRHKCCLSWCSRYHTHKLYLSLPHTQTHTLTHTSAPAYTNTDTCPLCKHPPTSVSALCPSAPAVPVRIIPTSDYTNRPKHQMGFVCCLHAVTATYTHHTHIYLQ